MSPAKLLPNVAVNIVDAVPLAILDGLDIAHQLPSALRKHEIIVTLCFAVCRKI